MFNGFFLRFVAALLVTAPASAAANQSAEQQSLVGMRVLDGKVATIGHRLAVANIDLCTERQWLPGIVIHDLSQYGGAYREAAIRAFGLDRGPGVLVLAAGGPAAQAGLREDDILLSADGTAMPRAPVAADRTFTLAERIIETLEAAFADGSADIRIIRGEERLSLRIPAEQGCASRFQLIPARRLNAHADGRYVQITTAIGGYVADDDELAAVLAHEFAHNVLGHRRRLDEAGVARGFFGNFGRNARLIRETEVEADRLSVYLLERAGYDMEAPVRFWSRFGRRGLNILGSPTHPNWRRRLALFQAEIDAVRRARAAGITPMPDFLAAAARTQPVAPPSG